MGCILITSRTTKRKIEMKNVKVKQSAQKIDRPERMKNFIKKLNGMNQKTTAYANAITAEKRFLASHYPALRTRSRIFAEYRQALAMTGFHHSFESNKAKLLKKYPHLENTLMGESAKEVMDKISQYTKLLKDKTTGEYDALTKLKVAVKAHYTMMMKSGERKAIVIADKMKVVDSKKSKTEVSKQAVEEAVTEGLKAKSIYKMAVALALCCGRRPIELFKNAQFEPASKNSVIFTGQAKQKGISRKDGFEIPIIHISAKAFMTAFDAFRKITDAKGYQELTREKINSRLGSELSPVARKLLKNDDVTYYSCRAIYAQYALETVKKPEVDTQVYIAQILGHDSDDVVTAMSYESVILTDKAPEEIQTIGKREKREEVLPLGVKSKADTKTKKAMKAENKRLEALKNLDVSAQGRAVKGLHDWILEHLETNPSVTITQTYITKNRSTSRPAIKAYLELIGDLAAND